MTLQIKWSMPVLQGICAGYFLQPTCETIIFRSVEFVQKRTKAKPVKHQTLLKKKMPQQLLRDVHPNSG